VSYHELTGKLVVFNQIKPPCFEADSIIREYLEECAKEVYKEICGEFFEDKDLPRGVQPIRKILGLSTEPLSAAAKSNDCACEYIVGPEGNYIKPCRPEHANSEAPQAHKGANPVSEKEWCKDIKMRKKMNSNGEWVDDCWTYCYDTVPHSWKMCPDCGKERPRTPTEQEELAKELQVLIDGFRMCKGHDADCSCASRLADRALTWFHEREKRK